MQADRPRDGFRATTAAVDGKPSDQTAILDPILDHLAARIADQIAARLAARLRRPRTSGSIPAAPPTTSGSVGTPSGGSPPRARC